MDVQVKVRYRGLRVQPAPPEVLHPLLTTVRQMPRMTADGVLCSVPLAEPHYRIDGDSLFTHAGLLHRVVLGLEQAGHCVEVIDQRPDWLHLARRRDKLLAIPDASELVKLVADLAILDQVDATDHDLLLAVAAASRGQIVLSDPRCLLRLMAVVCRLFSQARILIPAASRAKVRHYQRQLVQLLKEPVQATFCKTWNPKCRVAVCNLASFNSPTFGNWDIVLYPGIGEAINRVNIDENLPYFDEQRLFVFVPYPAKLNARAQLRLEAACGAVIHRQATQPDARSVQVYFSCLPITSDHQHRSKTDKLTAYQRKRQLVWHNGSRNDIIAAIARAFSAGDIQQLWQHGLLLQEQED